MEHKDPRVGDDVIAHIIHCFKEGEALSLPADTLFRLACEVQVTRGDAVVVVPTEGYEALVKAVAGHAAVMQYFLMGRPDLALEEALKWVATFHNMVREDS
ncbi:hypothetical protein V8N76_004541 [Salmonella enterica]